MLRKGSQHRLTAQLLILSLFCLTTLTALSDRVSAVSSPDITSQWSAEGNAEDSRGANNGLLQGTVTYASGKLGQAFNFDGNGFVEVPNSPTLESSTVTVAAWVKGLGSPGAYRYVLAKGLQNCNTSSFGLYTGEEGGLSFYINDGSTHVRSPWRGPEIWDGGWHYVAGSYDSANVRFYVDGREVGAGTETTISMNYGLPTDQKFYIGAQSSPQIDCGTPTSFIGYVDELKVWNRALSASEIHEDFAADTVAANETPLTNDQFVTTNEDTPRSLTLYATDADGDTLTYSVVTGPSHGTLTGTAPDLTYTPEANYNGSDSFTFKANDGNADSNGSLVTIAIASVNDAPAAVNDSYVAAKDTPLIVSAPGILANDSDADGDQVTATKVRSPAHGTLVLSPNGSFTYTPAFAYTGADSFTYRINDPDADSVATVNISVATRTATTSTLTISKSPQQYSDRITLEATITPLTAGGPPPALSVTFKVGTQVMGSAPMVQFGNAYKGSLTVPLLEPTPYGSTPSGQMKPTPLGRSVSAVFNDVSPAYTVVNATRSMMITKEEARATFTGQTFASTSCASCATTTVTLSATIQDISATSSANGDRDPGDIRHATVTFINRDTGASISPLLNVTLPDPNDTQTGSVRYNWSVNLGTADAQTFRVGILVDPSYYVRFNSSDDTLVTVAKPLTSGFITGGGNLVMSNSAGLKPGEAGTLNDFSFGVRYRAGSSPTGNFSTIVRSRVSGTLRVFQIKKNTLTSVVVTGNKAILKGTASIYDITNGSSLLDASATFEASLTDVGTGGPDTMAITIRDRTNALWFSSNWNGVKTTEDALASGEVKVR